MMIEDFTEAMQRTDNPDTNRRVVVMALRQLARLEAEQDDQNAWYQTVYEAYSTETSHRREQRERLTAVVEEIAKEMLPPDSQHVDIPGMARIQFKTTAKYLRVADPIAVAGWAAAIEEPGLLEHIPATDKPITTAVKAFAERTLAETGEVLAGMELVPEATSMKIERAKEAHRG